MEQMRFCNSGTEANLYALSIARQATGLTKVIVFNGAYHGGVLTFVHDVAVNTVDKNDWILGRYNDEEGIQRLISDNKGIAAAVLVEGMQGAGGCIPGSARFLHTIQKSTNANGMIFIMDEVMTSRLAPGGLQSIILDPQDNAPLKPDITTLGKYIAGGMTIGVFGGRKELLSMYDPRSFSESTMQGNRNPAQMSHSGTFNNNVLAMNVGLVALSTVYTPEVCTELNSLGDWFRQELLNRCQGTRMTVTGVGAVCNIHFGSYEDGLEILRTEDLEARHSKTDSIMRDVFWFYAVQKGFWIARRGMLALTMGTTRSELQGFLNFVESFTRTFRDLQG
jgi:glutamate-1-semialdehyde 2,1-aminomutase